MLTATGGVGAAGGGGGGGREPGGGEGGASLALVAGVVYRSNTLKKEKIYRKSIIANTN